MKQVDTAASKKAGRRAGATDTPPAGGPSPATACCSPRPAPPRTSTSLPSQGLKGVSSCRRWLLGSTLTSTLAPAGACGRGQGGAAGSAAEARREQATSQLEAYCSSPQHTPVSAESAQSGTHRSSPHLVGLHAGVEAAGRQLVAAGRLQQDLLAVRAHLGGGAGERCSRVGQERVTDASSSTNRGTAAGTTQRHPGPLPQHPSPIPPTTPPHPPPQHPPACPSRG